jgi:cyclopropane fatty-acyl-phospholipid synthase-like methyltransferase
MYRLEFKTGNKLGAGTDAAVRVELADAMGRKWKPYFAQVCACVRVGGRVRV